MTSSTAQGPIRIGWSRAVTASIAAGIAAYLLGSIIHYAASVLPPFFNLLRIEATPADFFLVSLVAVATKSLVLILWPIMLVGVPLQLFAFHHKLDVQIVSTLAGFVIALVLCFRFSGAASLLVVVAGISCGFLFGRVFVGLTGFRPR